MLASTGASPSIVLAASASSALVEYGRPRKRCRWLIADKDYNADALRRYCDRDRIQPVIPLCSMKRKPKPGLPKLCDRPKYRQCNIIKRMFGWLKENLRIVTRFDKFAKGKQINRKPRRRHPLK